MVATPSTGGTASATTTMRPTPSIAPGQPNPTIAPLSTGSNIYPVYAPHIPYSLRKAPILDMSTVERRGHSHAARESHKRVRPHGLQEAPSFRPTMEEFHDPMAYCRKIAPQAAKYGICKVIPPDGWDPAFAIDTEVGSRSTNFIADWRLYIAYPRLWTATVCELYGTH